VTDGPLINEFRNALFRDLTKLHSIDNIFIEQQKKLFESGHWTGLLNALDKNSPHCSKNYDACVYWWSKARIYFDEIMEENKSKEGEPKSFYERSKNN